MKPEIQKLVDAKACQVCTHHSNKPSRCTITKKFVNRKTACSCSNVMGGKKAFDLKDLPNA